jgi:nucleoside-diphosphate-sugar epimerase
VNVLVIGGSRFLGYHLVRRLLQDGHEVTVFNRGQTPDDFSSSVKRIRGDRRDRDDFRRKLGRKNYDAVADLIAYNQEDSRSAVETFEGRTGHYIHISTGAVYIVVKDYPNPIGEEDFDRELRAKPDQNDGMWLYGFNKRQCEAVLAEAHQQRGFQATAFRLPIVQGERDYTLRAYSYFLRIGDDRPLILPDGGLCAFTHVYQGDVVRSIAENLCRPASFGRAYNLAQQEIVTLREFVLKAARILGAKPELVDIPRQVLEGSDLGVGFSPFSSRRPFILSTERAERELGFKPMAFEDWLERIVLWFRDEYRGGPPENYTRREEEASFARRYLKAVASLRQQ